MKTIFLRNLLIVGGALFLIFSTPIFAASSQEGNKGEWFSKMDSNGDGKISKDEAKGSLKDRFDKVDSNSDGYITQDELGSSMKNESKGNKHHGNYGNEGEEHHGGNRGNWEKHHRDSDNNN
ncbi:hypothetical protein NURINAE_00042 [Candidatus Nitrosacidococcus sp. I8]|nr:hypothetical protein NURINAE_00042 [Candidatus Nitrosacidococcus sp. I8]